jgi:hypothetical protein
MSLNQSKYYQILKPNIDENGLIVQSEADQHPGGDTLHREGFMALIASLLHEQGKIATEELEHWQARFEANLAALKDPHKPGNYARHVNKYRWFGRYDIMSRDQWLPVAAAIGALSMKPEGKDLIWGAATRGFILTTNSHPNTDEQKPWKLPDLMGPKCWALMLRIFPNKLSNLLLPILDLEMLINSWLWIWKFKNKPNDTDILNHWVTLVRAKQVGDNFISKLARKLMRDRIANVRHCFHDYFNPSTNAPAFHLILDDVLEGSLAD